MLSADNTPLGAVLDKGENWEGTIILQNSQGRGRKTSEAKTTTTTTTKNKNEINWPGDFPKYFNLDKIICWLLYLHFENSFNLYVCINVFSFFKTAL